MIKQLLFRVFNALLEIDGITTTSLMYLAPKLVQSSLNN